MSRSSLKRSRRVAAGGIAYQREDYGGGRVDARLRVLAGGLDLRLGVLVLSDSGRRLSVSRVVGEDARNGRRCARLCSRAALSGANASLRARGKREETGREREIAHQHLDLLGHGGLRWLRVRAVD